jgi:hypothetical protein
MQLTKDIQQSASKRSPECEEECDCAEQRSAIPKKEHKRQEVVTAVQQINNDNSVLNTVENCSKPPCTVQAVQQNPCECACAEPELPDNKEDVYVNDLPVVALAMGVPCTPETVITTEEECRRASDILTNVVTSSASRSEEDDEKKKRSIARPKLRKVIYNYQISNSNADLPKGCSAVKDREDSTSIFYKTYFNSHEKGTNSKDRVQICKANKDTPSPNNGGSDINSGIAFVRIGNGKSCEGNGLRPITDLEGCQRAARYLRLSDTTPGKSTRTNMPYGCYFREKSSAKNRVWSNTNPANKKNGANEERDLLCEKVNTPSPPDSISSFTNGGQKKVNAFIFYERVKDGKRCVGDLRPVSDVESCGRAAKFLHLGDTEPGKSSKTGMPYNCYYRAKSSAYSRLWFNNNPANNRNPADAERDLLCERDVQAVIMRFNGECPPSRLIDNEEDCKLAAEKLRLPYTIGTNTDDLPRGCSISKDRHVFFNSHKIGRTSYERQPICYGYDRPGADQNKENLPHQNNPDNDYVLLENGQLNCPSGKEVADADECKQAYRSLTSRFLIINLVYINLEKPISPICYELVTVKAMCSSMVIGSWGGITLFNYIFE